MARQFVEKSLLHIILQMKSNNLYSQALYYRCIVISFEVFATTSRACITMIFMFMFTSAYGMHTDPSNTNTFAQWANTYLCIHA